MKQPNLMELPTGKLLDKFGAGSHKPGSGSAAALMGILSGKLIITVGELSLTKPKYRENFNQIEFLMKQIRENIEPSLKELFERDAIVFDQVIKLRVARDQSSDEKIKRKLGEQALEALREATDIPLQICEDCLKLIDYGTAMFDLGFQAARGDSGAGISAAVAGAMSSIFVVNLNLRSFRDSEWARTRRERVDELHARLEEKQLEAFGKIGMLKESDIESIQVEIDA